MFKLFDVPEFSYCPRCGSTKSVIRKLTSDAMVAFIGRECQSCGIDWTDGHEGWAPEATTKGWKVPKVNKIVLQREM